MCQLIVGAYTGVTEEDDGIVIFKDGEWYTSNAQLRRTKTTIEACAVLLFTTPDELRKQVGLPVNEYGQSSILFMLFLLILAVVIFFTWPIIFTALDFAVRAIQHFLAALTSIGF